MTKKVIAFSLWGDNPKYTIGAIKNAEIARDYWLDWQCTFYVGNDVPQDILSELLRLKCNIYNMGDSGWNGMFWRFFAADSENIVISRDTDSRLGEREKAAVDDWLSSNKDFHIIRDHPYHAAHIMGGMWGARNGILKGVKDWINNWDKGKLNNKWQVDQAFLRDIIYPIVKDNAKVHDPFFENKPFPFYAPVRTERNFVGNAFDANDRMITDEDYIPDFIERTKDV